MAAAITILQGRVIMAPQAQAIAVPTVRAALQAQVIWILRRAHRKVSRLKSREPAIKKKFLYI
jgi:hypothetical protein